jgi:hypothetical protein
MKKNKDSLEGNQFIGWVKVSSKGQVAIPTEIRKKSASNRAIDFSLF